MTTQIDVPALLAAMTLEEKASLCSGADLWHTRRVERLDVPAVMVTDGPHGLRKQAADQDHLGISGSVPATCFPTASALGSSWDPELVHRVGVALGEEARAEDVAVLLGPGINIKRSPLCGRNFEYLSEDPYLSGELGAAMVEGIQSQGVGTSLKHYAVNNQETDRLRVSAEVDERTLREIYLAGFERVVTGAHPWTVMCSYNRINGTYASQDPWLLTEVLRGEWGYDGLVVSDWGAVDDCVAAVEAGLDLEMPSTGRQSPERLVAAVRDGELAEAVLDRAVGRLLQLIGRALPGVESDDAYDRDEHHALARRVAQDCAVLLKNDGDLLPLRPTPGSRVAVIGEFARTPRYQGAGSSKVNPTQLDTALDALRAGVPDGVTVDFAAGFGIDTTEGDDALLAEAVALAGDADHVVVFLGLPASAESEGYDRDHIDLPANQIALLAGVAAAHPRLAVVLANGSAVAMADWVQHADAVLECWLSGQAAGGAAADLLLGAATPSGRLAETIPLRLEDTPSFLAFPGEEGKVRYGEGVFVGYRFYDATSRAVSFPFGHGLSYTTFGYDDLAVTVLDQDDAVAVEVACTVTNRGDVAGKEVVQVYVGDPEAAVRRPERELKAFAKVALEPGASQEVRFTLTGRDLSYWSTRAKGWVLEGGAFEIAVGASSRDLRLTTSIEVDAPPIELPIERGSTLAEWLAHPVAGPTVRSTLKNHESGDLSGLLEDADLVRMLGSFPLNRIIAFVGLSQQGLDELVVEVNGG
ncbi:MAG: glycoside hydrolase family 3 domain protein [Acidimicrobiales bacterium]|nr:glycoside hydrolase family 3 domain protein [Acidimicrobiales bacterium]